MLLVTDADGNTVESFRDTDICNRYLPSKYNDDVSSEYRKTVPDLEWQLGYTKYGGAELAQFLPFARIEGEKHKYVITISTNKPLAAVDIFINGVDVSVDGVADGKIIMSITVKDMMQRPYAYFNAFPFVLDQPYATDETEKTCEFLWGGILGLAVADALGVPVEFQSRESLRRNPVTEMRGHGTYKQPPGTWSDDTSLTLCLLDSLANKKIDWKVQRPFQPDYADTMQRFLSWADKAEYTAHGTVFDIGIATRKALQRFKEGTDPLECGGTLEQDNGNGSLMRILPLAFYLYSVIGEDFMIKEESIKIINEVSSLTHAHKRSQIACGIYLSVAQQFFDKAWFVGWDWRRSEEDWENAIRAGLKSAIHAGLEWTEEYYKSKTEYAKELKHYKRLFKKNFAKLPEEKIKSSGYVVDTLEAAIWCLLNTDNYKDCVLKAGNLGEDTDTVAAVAGGLAGMYYGVEGIPKKWLKKLARRDYIEKLCGNFGIAHIIGWNQDSYFAYSNSER
jgi:ADP-ribosylglycohydrolase